MIVHRLIAAGADVNAQRDDGNTALDLAAENAYQAMRNRAGGGAGYRRDVPLLVMDALVDAGAWTEKKATSRRIEEARRLGAKEGLPPRST